MSENEKAILSIVPFECGYTTKTVAKKLGRSFGHNQRTYSHWVFSVLKRLEESGHVKRLDSEKPIVWTKCKLVLVPADSTTEAKDER